MAGKDTTTFAVLPEESAVLIEARSSVGPISFATTAMTGQFRAVLVGGEIDVTEDAQASLVLPVSALTSGNQLYDAELRTRLNAQRYPSITAELGTAAAIGAGRFSVTGDLTIHGTTRRQTGTLDISVTDAAPASQEPESASTARVTVVVFGTQIVDIRDFDIELPSMLMLQIYPDVTVRFRVTAVSDDYSQRTEH
jgi:YceI-like domain